MKYSVITYGCQMNKSDSERIIAKLKKQKHQPAKDIKRAGLVVINVCSVRQSAINRLYSKVKQLNERKPKPKIILTGCILEKDKKRLKNQTDQIWPIINSKTKPQCQSKKESFVPIMTGCDNYCSYCVVPYTRGREKSRPAREITDEIKGLIRDGFKKIILLGQNVNSYSDKEADFPKLLEMIEKIEGKFQIEFLTSHPKDFSEKLIEIISKSKKISRKIHLPVQSGDNQILEKMNRGYTVGQYKKLIKKIRENIPDTEISTDIIVGFPTETEKQFQNTVKLVREIRFSHAYVSSYSPRDGTAASRLKDNVPSDEKKRRKKILLEIFG